MCGCFRASCLYSTGRKSSFSPIGEPRPDRADEDERHGNRVRFALPFLAVPFCRGGGDTVGVTVGGRTLGSLGAFYALCLLAS